MSPPDTTNPDGEAARRRAARLVARAIVFLRYPIVVAWAVAAVWVPMQLPDIGEVEGGIVEDLIPANSEAIATERRSRELFAVPSFSRTAVLLRDEEGLSPRAVASLSRYLLGLNRDETPGDPLGGALPVPNALPPLDELTAVLSFLFIDPSLSQIDQTEIGRAVADSVERLAGSGEAFVTGTVPARISRGETILDYLPLVELATLAAVILIVAIHFRAVGAPLLDLAAVAVAYFVGTRIVAVGGEAAGLSVPREVEPLVVALVFGTVTDYVIFFLSRFRGHLAAGEPKRDAAVETTTELLPVVLTAGLIVVGAAATLLLAGLDFIRSFGPGMAIGVAVGVAVVLTLVPAILAIAGKALLWPHGARPEHAEATGRAAERERRGRLVGFAARHPATVTIASVAVLGAAASGLLRIELGNPIFRGLPESSAARQGYEAAGEAFGTPGVVVPTLVLLEGEGIAEERPALARLEELIERRPEVAQAVGPSLQPLGEELGVALAETGDAARIALAFEQDPLGNEAIEALKRLERRMPALLDQAGLEGVEASFGGSTALFDETIERTVDAIWIVIPAASLVVFVLLALLLRALVAPLYLVAAGLLAVAASLGLTVYVFQGLLGQPEISFLAPFTVAVLLLALGSDYNVFIVARIWDSARTKSLREAIAEGGSRAARAITVAGLILAASFAAVWLIPIRSFHQLAFAMSAGLLIDALLVRTLLIPALVSLFGAAGGWPGKRLRRAAERGGG